MSMSDVLTVESVSLTTRTTRRKDVEWCDGLEDLPQGWYDESGNRLTMERSLGLDQSVVVVMRSENSGMSLVLTTPGVETSFVVGARIQIALGPAEAAYPAEMLSVTRLFLSRGEPRAVLDTLIKMVDDGHQVIRVVG